MATTLTETWNAHAFPDDYPAKEQVWAQEAEARRDETRREIYLEQSGSGLRIRRHTSDKADRADAKAARLDDMLLAIGSPAYMEAYNTQLSFSIDGQNFDISQGQLYDNAKQRAEDLQRQIDDARKRGASVEDIARLQGDLDALRIIQAQTDPQHGPITPDSQQIVSQVLQERPGLRGVLQSETITPTAKADIEPDRQSIQRLDDKKSQVEGREISDIVDLPQTASFASNVTESPFASVPVSASKDFTAAAEGAPDITPDSPAPTTPNQTPGFNFG